MEQTDYHQTWSAIYRERQELVSRRTELENELVEIRNSISHLDEILEHLAPLAGIAMSAKSLSKLGLTDAIRTILRSKGERFSPSDIRQRLISEDYDLSGLTAPMASIYKILNRLAAADEVERQKEEDGSVFYKWKGLTDDDIPF
jgi:hypothetical protein